MAEDKVKTLEFIEDYRKYEVLWDNKHKDYNNKLKRNAALIAIGKKHNYDIQTVKNKIKSLRSYFSKEHQKFVKKNSDPEAEENYESQWFAYKSLSFILDSDIVEVTVENLSNNTSQDDSTESQASRWENDHEFVQPLRRKRNIIQSRVDEREEEAYEIIKTASGSGKTSNRDECDAFAELIAIKLRKLNQRNRLLAERQINEIFFNLEMEELNSAQ